jgi:D-alanyl-D-alanine carboxypeptidase
MRASYVTAIALLVACKQNPSKLDHGSHAPRDAAVASATTFAEDLEKIRAKLGLPALAAAAWRDGSLLDIAAVGVRKAGDPTTVTTKDEWHLGSNTKAMTATVIAMYVDRGKLHWDDTIATLFPGWKIDPGYAKVTLDQLLHHESGAPGEPPADLWKQLWADGDAADAREKFVRGVLSRPPAQAPGTFVYSNAGYMIAGAALERAAGQPWKKLMQDELFAKLDMKSCGFGAPGVKDVIDQPRGHDAGGTALEPGPAADNPPGLGPAGNVHCSLEDYGKFLNMHALGTPTLITAESAQHLHTAADDNKYAGGWLVVQSPNGPILMHSGSNTMWHVTALVGLGTKVTFAIATNKEDPRLEDELGPLLLRFKKK